MTADLSVDSIEPLPGGWVMVSAPPLRQRLSVVDDVILFVPVMFVGLVPTFLRMIFGEFTIWGVVLAFVGYLAAWFGVVLLIALWRSRVWVNFETGQLRVGRKVTELADIDSAVLALSNNRGVPSLSLHLRTGNHLRAVIPIRHRSDVLLTDQRQRRLLAELLARTCIELPDDPHDPQKKFARYNFPGHIDRETTIDLVLNPPEAYGPLPVSY